MVGKDVSASAYDNSGYTGHNGGPISQGSDLNCDFSSSCCWQDSPDGALHWQLGTGAPENAKMNRNFGTTTAPSKNKLFQVGIRLKTLLFSVGGNFLVVPAESAAGSGDQAKFVSCSIACTTGPISISLRYINEVEILLRSYTVLHCKALGYKRCYNSSMHSSRWILKSAKLSKSTNQKSWPRHSSTASSF